MSHQSIWATGDDNTSWNFEPQLKKPRNVQASADTIVVGTGNTASSAGRSKAIGNMFFKTKLCCKFRAGVCPYVTDCNFAHGMEELCHPPTNWQDIVAAHDDEGGNLAVQRREEHAIPTFGSGEIRGESMRSHKGRHCKKFYTEEGCPYGDSCTFMHEEQSRSRESVAISLNPFICGSSTSAADATGSGNDVPGPNLKPSNWKTRICNKWETTGSCPFGIKCHFAHGLQELHKYGGGLLETEGRDLSTDQKQVGAVSEGPTNTIVAAVSIAAPRTDSCLTGLGASLQRWPSSVAIQALGQCHLQKWKGPNKISKIYGDWIDDIE